MSYEIIGTEELVAWDDDGWDEVDDLLSGYDLIGARYPIRRRGGRPSPRRHAGPPVRGGGGYNAALTQAAAMKQAAAGLIVREQAPNQARRLVLPMESTGTVAAGAAAAITSRPQTIAFKPTRVVIPSTIAPDFILTDIKVGNRSQLVQSGNLSAEAFSPTSFVEGEMDMDTVQTSQDFVLQVQNISGVARTFRAVIFGRAIDR